MTKSYRAMFLAFCLIFCTASTEQLVACDDSDRATSCYPTKRQIMKGISLASNIGSGVLVALASSELTGSDALKYVGCATSLVASLSKGYNWCNDGNGDNGISCLHHCLNGSIMVLNAVTAISLGKTTSSFHPASGSGSEMDGSVTNPTSSKTALFIACGAAAASFVLKSLELCLYPPSQGRYNPVTEIPVARS